jgi:primase-polymerase (primpol)-like protein
MPSECIVNIFTMLKNLRERARRKEGREREQRERAYVNIITPTQESEGGGVEIERQSRTS